MTLTPLHPIARPSKPRSPRQVPGQAEPGIGREAQSQVGEIARNGMRYHYASHPIRLDTAREYAQDSFKPCGLWYSIGDAWARWCRAEEFQVEGLRSRQRVGLNGAQILRLDTERRVLAFAEEYAGESTCGIGRID